MIRTLAPSIGNRQRAVTVILGLGAAAGWGMLAVSSQPQLKPNVSCRSGSPRSKTAKSSCCWSGTDPKLQPRNLLGCAISSVPPRMRSLVLPRAELRLS